MLKRLSGTVVAMAVGMTLPEFAVAQPPTARPDTQPLATVDAQLKFSRLSVKDPGINNIEAVSFLIPNGWKPEGGVQWFPDHSILANLLMTVTDPQTGAQVQFLPVQNFSWVDNPVMPMQVFSNYMGNIVHPPMTDIPRFIQTMYATAPHGVAQHLLGARQVTEEPLPKVAAQVSAAYGGQARVVASRVRYEFDRQGAPWEEDVFVTLILNSQQGMTIWSVGSAYAFCAPKGELDRVTPCMTTIISTIRLSQDWFGGYMYVQSLFQNRMRQGIQNAAAISATITRNSEDIRRMYSDAYQRQSESQDRISRCFSESIRGVQSYQDPFLGRPVQLPSGYDGAWVNAQGQIILTPPGGVDPNVGSTVEWRRMEAPPR